MPGALLLSGKYQLDAPLAVGGMSTVWLATHVTLGRSVAVKFIDLESLDLERVTERFLREARLAASIHHPNVIDVVDFGIAENGEPVMVMELLEGESLEARLTREPALTTCQVVHVMAQVLGALDAVHRAGILHCDMKPGNVMLGTMNDATDIFAWLIDFGIAYAVDPRSDLRRGRFGTDMHVVTGTPEYMAPEQAEGRTDLDERVDVYAASVMLYELLTGRCPYTDAHPGRVIFKVIQGGHVPLTHLRPDIPKIAAVVEMALAQDRRARPASARDLKRLLLEALARERSAGGSLAPSSVEPRQELKRPRESQSAISATPTAVTPSAEHAAPLPVRVPRGVVALASTLGALLVSIGVYGAALRAPEPSEMTRAEAPSSSSVPQRTAVPAVESVSHPSVLDPVVIESAASEPGVIDVVVASDHVALPIELALDETTREAVSVRRARLPRAPTVEPPEVAMPKISSGDQEALEAGGVEPSAVEFVEDPGF